ncbi:MAG: prepilin-type N-terminal cleavage/methylation domain-containing protein, partial [Planctomycetota bacterium]|nr:prepilin-type N-terminal cleavage/methylation domain-containing protein [Planctomycetota bacterium]
MTRFARARSSDRSHKVALKRRRRSGLTLVELLVAATITLLLVYGLAQAFAVVSVTVSSNRASVEMLGQLRGVTMLLQRDLEGLTVPVRPWPRPESGLGYFEIVEGVYHDGSAYLANSKAGMPSLAAHSCAGDPDDVLMFTSRSVDVPFRGLHLVEVTSGGSIVNVQTQLESQLAEIAWWATMNDQATSDTNSDGILDAGNNTLNVDQRDDYTLYRRVLLIRPDLNTAADATHPLPYYKALPSTTTSFSTGSQPGLQAARLAIQNFHADHDLSVRYDVVSTGSNQSRIYVSVNSLADLANRRNRFAHYRILMFDPSNTANLLGQTPSFPYRLNRDNAMGLPLTRTPVANSFVEPGLIKGNAHRGEDIVLVNALAFDVKVYDPGAPVGIDPSGVEAVVPGDPGFAHSSKPVNGVDLYFDGMAITKWFLPIGTGAYIDLNYTSTDTNYLRDYADIATGGAYTYNQIQTGSYKSNFSGAPHSDSQLTPTSSLLTDADATSDTWSFYYESDGVNQDGDADTDEGT